MHGSAPEPSTTRKGTYNVTDRSRKTGFSFIELLVALAIGVLVLGLVFGIYWGVRRGIGADVARASAMQETMAASRVLERDLWSAAFPAVDEGAGFALRADGEGRLVELRFVTALPSDDRETPLSRHLLAEVRYVLESQGGDADERRFTLGRIVRPLGATSRDAPERFAETLPGSYAGIHIELYDGEAWRTQWPEPEQLPWAFRLRLTPADAHAAEMARSGLVPAGQRMRRERDARAEEDQPATSFRTSSSRSTDAFQE